ncbi:MAG: hypothetical protein PHX62_06030 [Bacilli bacterium]|nr:hypothetical protein [Bacilli bacterium]
MLQENYDYLIAYNTLDPVEENFFMNILQLIINYPLIWFNFLENILKNKIMISFRARALIVSLELLTKQLKNSFDHVFRLMRNSNVVSSTIEKKGFLIIYVYSEAISEFFQNSGFWLEYLTAYACREIGFPCHRGVLFKTKDRHISEIDVLVDLGRALFFIECKDTYSYSNFDLKKIDNLKKRINRLSYGIFVCTKATNNLNFKKYDLGLIKYRYNYEIFKEELKDLIGERIVSLSF